jgi:hypothetical protein
MKQRAQKDTGRYNRRSYRLTNLTGELPNLKVRCLVELQKEPHCKSSKTVFLRKAAGITRASKKRGHVINIHPYPPHEKMVGYVRLACYCYSWFTNSTWCIVWINSHILFGFLQRDKVLVVQNVSNI